MLLPIIVKDVESKNIHSVIEKMINFRVKTAVEMYYRIYEHHDFPSETLKINRFYLHKGYFVKLKVISTKPNTILIKVKTHDEEFNKFKKYMKSHINTFRVENLVEYNTFLKSSTACKYSLLLCRYNIPKGLTINISDNLLKISK